jgi:hypothetical protein
VTDFNLPIPGELIERIAESIAERALDVFADWLASGTQIAPGTFDKLAARGRIPSHSADGGRRKLYHREELDDFLGYARRYPADRGRWSGPGFPDT